jgi:hypothetical protein
MCTGYGDGRALSLFLSFSLLGCNETYWLRMLHMDIRRMGSIARWAELLRTVACYYVVCGLVVLLVALYSRYSQHSI